MAHSRKSYGIRYGDGLWFQAGKVNGTIEEATLFQDQRTAELSANSDPDATVTEVVGLRLTREDYDKFLPLQAGDFPTHTPGAKAKAAQEEAPPTESQTTLSTQPGFSSRRKTPSHRSE